MVFLGSLTVSGSLTSCDATVAAVITDACVVHVVVGDARVVGIVDHGDVYVVYGPVVGEMTAVPSAAVIPLTDISETVIDAAVDPDMRSPIAHMPHITAATPAPVSGRPEHTDARRQHPGARHPEIVVVTIS